VIEIKGLCVMCGPALYFETPYLRYYADGEWVPAGSLPEVLDLATAGVELMSSSGHPFRPRAAFLLNGSSMCGLCISGLGPNAVQRAILTGHTGRYS
jgi:hypothetical protein